MTCCLLRRLPRQALKVSRVLQAFRIEAVRGPRTHQPSCAIQTVGHTSIANSKHYRLLRGGRVSKAPAKSEYGGTVSIFEAYRKRMRDARDEGAGW